MNRQIFHHATKNELCGNEFIRQYLNQATSFHTDAEVLRAASDAVGIEGFYLEMGVYKGKTINFIAALNPQKTIYGFDSFEGLPEDWIRGDSYIAKESFRFRNPPFMPSVLSNVALIKGWFKETLPLFKAQLLQNNPIAFLHVDSDLYSSAKTIFEVLSENIIPGTIILFDEFYNYKGYEDHEFKAFQEFLEKHAYSAEYLAYNSCHEQVALRIQTI